MGFIFGVLTPIFAMIVFMEMYPALKAIRSWADPAWQRLLTYITTFGVGINAAMFFLSFKMNKERVGKGILVACILYIFALLFMQIATRFLWT